MYYKNIFSRFLFRKNLLRRIFHRLRAYKRQIVRNEFDDLAFLFNKLKHHPQYIIDGGANIGFVTFQFQKRFSDAQIFSFEPNPAVFKKLQHSYQNTPNITALNLGIGEQSGTLTFHLNANTGTSSFLAPNAFHKANQARRTLPPIEVPVVSLDNFIIQKQIPQIDILKLDIEGFELNALKGLTNALRGDQIRTIVLEFNLVPTYEGQPLLHHLISFLEAYDFSVYNLYGYQENKARQAIIGNMILISKSFRKELEDAFGSENFGW